MSENIPVETKSKKNKKNKKDKGEKHTHENCSHEGHSHDHSHAPETDFMEKFSKLLGQDSNVDFTNFDKNVETIRTEISGIRAVLEDINTGKFQLIPDEEKDSKNIK